MRLSRTPGDEEHPATPVQEAATELRRGHSITPPQAEQPAVSDRGFAKREVIVHGPAEGSPLQRALTSSVHRRAALPSSEQTSVIYVASLLSRPDPVQIPSDHVAEPAAPHACQSVSREHAHTAHMVRIAKLRPTSLAYGA